MDKAESKEWRAEKRLPKISFPFFQYQTHFLALLIRRLCFDFSYRLFNGSLNIGLAISGMEFVDRKVAIGFSG